MPLFFLVFAPLAQAATVTVSGGAELGVDDPYVVRRGLGVSVEVAPVEWFDIGAAAVGYPELGEADYTARTRDILDLALAPDISRITSITQLHAGFTPLHATLGGVRTGVGAYAGVGLAATHDDLPLIYAENEPAFVATERERHLAAILGVRGEADVGHVVVQLRVERVSYQEVVGSAIQEAKTPTFVGVDVGWRFGGPRTPPTEATPAETDGDAP